MAEHLNDTEPGYRLSRRQLLGAIGGSPLMLGAGPLRIRDLLGGQPTDLARLAAEEWGTMRRHFLLKEGLVYLNNGTLGPCPRHVLEEMLRAWLALEENPADEGFGPLLKRMDEVRAQAARFLGCGVDETALTRSTTEGMNTVAQGLRLQKGDRILTTDHEHPGGRAGWEYLARRDGVEIDEVRLPVPEASPEEIVALFEAKLTPRTRVVSVSHVTFSTGLRLPVRRLADLLVGTDTLLVVDGAQAPGVLDVDVKALGCDTYATSAHKWMLAPKGTGLLYISARARDRVAPLLLQDGYGAYTASTGTRDLPGIIGLGAAMEFLSAIGKERVQARAMSLRNALAEGLNRLPRLRVVSPRQPELCSALVSVALPDGVSGAAVAAALREKHGVIVKVLPQKPVSGLRFSSHLYNTPEDGEKLLHALNAVLGA